MKKSAGTPSLGVLLWPCVPTLELVQVAERHHGTNLHWISVQQDSESRSCFLCSTHWQTKEEAALLAILLQEVRDRNKV